MPDFRHVDTFLFDLDYTLYPRETRLIEQIWNMYKSMVQRHTGFAPAKVDDLLEAYEAVPGTDVILAVERDYGLPRTDFWDAFHKIDLSPLTPCLHTFEGLGRLKGRKVIFTNATSAHAERVLEHLGLVPHFDTISGVTERADRIKPNPDIYTEMVHELGLTPAKTAMIEDTSINLKPAHALAMTTVLIHPQNPGHDWVHHWHPTLLDWLEKVRQ